MIHSGCYVATVRLDTPGQYLLELELLFLRLERAHERKKSNPFHSNLDINSRTRAIIPVTPGIFAILQ